MAKIVIALGGNALGNTPGEQKNLIRFTAKIIVDLIEDGHTVIIGHGNGPQVGMINLAMDYSYKNGGKTPYMPLTECGAMSEGYIGYHLQQGLINELKNRNVNKDVVTLITQVLVDKNDDAFNNPTKPIGSFLTKDEADVESLKAGFTFVEDSGRGYRRVVPSPLPKEILEISTINKLINDGVLVITVGGGGIPVIETDSINGIDAVIDKDMSCSLLGDKINADILLILTAVDKVSLNYKKENQIDLDKMTVKEAREFINEGHFAKGSMLPKVIASLNFVEKDENRKAIITSLEKASEGLTGKTGTVIVN